MSFTPLDAVSSTFEAIPILNIPPDQILVELLVMSEYNMGHGCIVALTIFSVLTIFTLYIFTNESEKERIHYWKPIEVERRGSVQKIDGAQRGGNDGRPD